MEPTAKAVCGTEAALQTAFAPKKAPIQNSFRAGFHDGIPIGLGYFSVSITFGMMAAAGGLPVWAALAISMTNVTSAGQFAGLTLIFGGGTLFETALTQLVINLRYTLMGLSLSQKLNRNVSLPDRLLFSFLLTDEVFAVTSGQRGEVGRRYLFGVMIAPYLGWSLGTLCGAVASGLLPDTVRSALSIAIYGMFIAIVAPAAAKSRPVLGHSVYSGAASPYLRRIRDHSVHAACGGRGCSACADTRKNAGGRSAAGTRGGGRMTAAVIWPYILVMAGVTYLLRMLPLTLLRRKLQSRFLQSFLYYVPYAVLAAMTVPAIFESTGSVLSAAVGFLAAVLLACRGASLEIVAVAACCTVFAAEWLMRLAG